VRVCNPGDWVAISRHKHLSSGKNVAAGAQSFKCAAQHATSDEPGRRWTSADTGHLSASTLEVCLLSRNRISGLILLSVSGCKVHKLVNG
jgi:hypothetical protein